MTPAPPETLARARALLVPALADAVRRLDPRLERVVAYHLGWIDADGAPVRGDGGKAVRPTLALLAAEAAGGKAHDALPGAVAIELVHNFSLLHDDVMDEDRERRHRPTAWVVFGVGPAICAGDALVVLANQVLVDEPTPARLRAAARLSEATQTMIAGQAADLAFEGRFDVGVPAYLGMSAGKTGALLGCAAALGALLVEAPAATVEALETFGRSLGLAFQAIDDWLGIWGRPEITGKPVGSDLRQRKASLPIVAAVEAGGTAAEELRALLTEGRLTEERIRRAIALVEANGGRERTQAEAEAQLSAALANLTALPGCEAVRELRELAHFIAKREF